MKVAEGKVRKIHDLGDGTIIIVTTDRISSFDEILPTKIPRKGEVLNRLSEFWFNCTKTVIPNHMITTDNLKMPVEFQRVDFWNRCMRVKKLKMLPVECIVRGYITGSGWGSYQKTGKVCGIELPQGLQESEKLPVPIYTPTTKAEEGHDEHMTYEDTVEVVGESLAAQLRDMSIKIYSMCAEYARERGIIIADTKFEFGVDEDGTLVLADEVLTPDSSRFWPAKEYTVGKAQKSFDKQYVRDWIKQQSGWQPGDPMPKLPSNVIEITSQKYINAYEMLTGKIF